MIEAPGPQPAGRQFGREAWMWMAVPGSVLVLLAFGLFASGLGVWPSTSLGKFPDVRKLAVAVSVIALASAVIGAGFLIVRRDRKVADASTPETSSVPGQTARQRLVATLESRINSQEQANSRVALHLVDIDRFRRLNLLLGEDAGDAFLRDIAERLRAVADNPDHLSRTGDDEFAVLQIGAGGPRHVEIFARRIRNALDDACAEVPAHARPGASAGAALCPEQGGGARKLLQCAAAALEAAKRDGGGQFRLYSAEMEAAARNRVEIEQALRDGLDQGWFDLLFQPQYDLHTRRLMGFEALLRLHHPQRGEILPDDFVPVAEDIGLMQPLGAWVISRAIATAADWPVHLTLSLNVSATQFRDGDVASTVVQALASSCFEGSRLNLEICEGLLWQASEPVRRQLRRLQRRGVRFVLDDFGVDSSQLQALVRSTCDAIKLDRSFVARVGKEPEADAIVLGLIGTAQAFELPVLAEGVERAEQAHFLMSHACRKVQGFLFGRPSRAGELGGIIAKDLRNSVSALGRQAPRAAPVQAFASRAASRISR